MGPDEWISFKLCWKINVQKSAQIISIWLDEFLQSEHTHITSPQDAYVLIGKGEKNLATVQKRGGDIIGLQYGIHFEVAIGLHKSVLFSAISKISLVIADIYWALTTGPGTSTVFYVLLFGLVFRISTLITFYHSCFTDVK